MGESREQDSELSVEERRRQGEAWLLSYVSNHAMSLRRIEEAGGRVELAVELIETIQEWSFGNLDRLDAVVKGAPDTFKTGRVNEKEFYLTAFQRIRDHQE